VPLDRQGDRHVKPQAVPRSMLNPHARAVAAVRSSCRCRSCRQSRTAAADQTLFNHRPSVRRRVRRS